MFAECDPKKVKYFNAAISAAKSSTFNIQIWTFENLYDLSNHNKILDLPNNNNFAEDTKLIWKSFFFCWVPILEYCESTLVCPLSFMETCMKNSMLQNTLFGLNK